MNTFKNAIKAMFGFLFNAEARADKLVGQVKSIKDKADAAVEAYEVASKGVDEAIAQYNRQIEGSIRAREAVEAKKEEAKKMAAFFKDM